MLVHCRVTPSSMLLVPIYTPGWKETMWGKVSCLRKQHNGRDWVLSYRPSDLKSNVLTNTPPCPHKQRHQGNNESPKVKVQQGKVNNVTLGTGNNETAGAMQPKQSIICDPSETLLISPGAPHKNGTACI